MQDDRPIRSLLTKHDEIEGKIRVEANTVRRTTLLEKQRDVLRKLIAALSKLTNHADLSDTRK